jgi:diacylglycerol kinase family enzyme
VSDYSALFVVNPHARGGKTREKWDDMYAKIQKNLSIQNEYVIADGIGTGVTSTIDGINDGHNIIVSVGGEGAANEVVNGIYQSGNGSVYMSFIRAGTVNDYLHVINWPEKLEDQVKKIEMLKPTPTPIVKVDGDTTRVGLNVADTGVGAAVAYSASVERRLKWIRGEFRYTLLALRAITRWKNIPLVMKADDRELEGGLSLLMSGFSTQSGAFRVLPHADPYGKQMAYTAAFDFSKLQMVKLMGILKEGSHTEEIEGVYMGHCDKIELEAEKPILFEVDGEPFSFDSTNITIEALPERIQVLV